MVILSREYTSYFRVRWALGGDGLPAVTGMCVHMWGPAPDPRAKRAVFLPAAGAKILEIWLFVAIFNEFSDEFSVLTASEQRQNDDFGVELH